MEHSKQMNKQNGGSRAIVLPDVLTDSLHQWNTKVQVLKAYLRVTVMLFTLHEIWHGNAHTLPAPETPAAFAQCISQP